MPDRPKPHSQRLAGVLKNCSSPHRSLMTASRTNDPTTARRPATGMATSRAFKTVRPTQLTQILTAGSLGTKTILQLQDRTWVIFHDHNLYLAVGGVN